MLLLKVVAVGCVALMAIILGGMVAAWRRACVAITRHVQTVNFVVGDGSGSERAQPPGPGELFEKDVVPFTPRWV